jgi:hypothetical protein
LRCGQPRMLGFCAPGDGFGCAGGQFGALQHGIASLPLVCLPLVCLLLVWLVRRIIALHARSPPCAKRRCLARCRCKSGAIPGFGWQRGGRSARVGHRLPMVPRLAGRNPWWREPDPKRGGGLVKWPAMVARATATCFSAVPAGRSGCRRPVPALPTLAASAVRARGQADRALNPSRSRVHRRSPPRRAAWAKRS